MEKITKKTVFVNESSADIRARVMKARAIQKERFTGTGIEFNAEMGSCQIERYCSLNESQRKMLLQALEKKNISLRSYYKIMKVARTIADLDGKEQIEDMHLLESLFYRQADEKYWKGRG
ncbi:MAG: hypothetical protein PUD93_06150 [Lachnospiraceae bacterium]|nr:hypothetical protein [Lachnospiraceae bacterium]